MSKTVQNPDAKATPSQTWAICLNTGYDVRETAITRGEASDLLDLASMGEDIISAVAEIKGAVLTSITPKKKGAERLRNRPKENGNGPTARRVEKSTTKPRSSNRSLAQRKLYRPRSLSAAQSALHLPQEIAEVIPDDVAFTVELTDEGVLYRATKIDVEPDKPGWAR